MLPQGIALCEQYRFKFFYIWWPLPLFYIYFCFLLGCRYKYKEQSLGCLGFALWMVLKKTGILSVEKMSCCDFSGLKSVEQLCHPSNHASHLSGSIGPVFDSANVLSFRLSISYSMKVRTQTHSPMEDFIKHNPNYPARQ